MFDVHHYENIKVVKPDLNKTSFSVSVNKWDSNRAVSLFIIIDFLIPARTDAPVTVEWCGSAHSPSAAAHCKPCQCLYLLSTLAPFTRLLSTGCLNPLRKSPTHIPLVPFFSIYRFLDLHEISCLHPSRTDARGGQLLQSFLQGSVQLPLEALQQQRGTSECLPPRWSWHSLTCSQGLAEHRQDFIGLTGCQRAVLLSSSNIF